MRLVNQYGTGISNKRELTHTWVLIGMDERIFDKIGEELKENWEDFR